VWNGIRVRSTPLYRRQTRLRRRLHRALHGSQVSIITADCVGGRISSLAGNEYRSPTVGLLLHGDSYFELVSDLPRYLKEPVVEDVDESARRGYPVGRMGRVTLYFMHYPTFAVAESAWRERAARVDPDNVVLVYTDRSGDPDADVARFAALPYARKLMFTAKEHPGVDCVATLPAYVGESTVGELFTEWVEMEPALKGARLDLFR